jgi:hypothetical protein
MCNFCKPILGYTRPHDESNCALKQATVCPHCGPCTHFLKDCPKRSKRIPRGFQAIPSSVPVDHPQVYRIAHTNQGYTEYLKLYKLESSASIDKNRKGVETHLQKRGYILQNPLEAPPMLEKTQVICKEVHAGNEACVILLDGAQSAKKKLSVKFK